MNLAIKAHWMSGNWIGALQVANRFLRGTLVAFASRIGGLFSRPVRDAEIHTRPLRDGTPSASDKED
jgi:hypothetical protein